MPFLTLTGRCSFVVHYCFIAIVSNGYRACQKFWILAFLICLNSIADSETFFIRKIFDIPKLRVDILKMNHRSLFSCLLKRASFHMKKYTKPSPAIHLSIDTVAPRFSSFMSGSPMRYGERNAMRTKTCANNTDITHISEYYLTGRKSRLWRTDL